LATNLSLDSSDEEGVESDDESAPLRETFSAKRGASVDGEGRQGENSGIMEKRETVG